MIEKNADGTFPHEVRVTLAHARPGITVFRTGEPRTGFLQGQWELHDILQDIRPLEPNTMQDFYAGWNIEVAINDERWSCLIGEEF